MRAPRGGFDVATVRAAQRGEQDALRDLLTEALPLVYNIVGFALQAHADVDDAVQETMMRAVRGLGELRDPGAFRSWLVAVALRQIHDHQRAHRAVLDRTMPLDEAFAVADPSAEFADLTALKLELTGQRQEVAEAAGWLDDGNRELLGLWWLSEHGRLDRAELAAALGVPQNQAAVRIQRLKEQLSATRVMVRALRAPERCRGLLDLTRRWDGHRNSLWRKRFVGHTRDCEVCDARSRDLVPVEKLLAGLPLAVVPTALAAAVFRAAMAAGAGSAGATGSAALGHGSSPAALGHGSTSSTALGHGSSAVGHGSGKALWFLPAKAPAVFAAVVTAGAVGVAATAVWAGSSTSGAVPLPPIATTSSPSPSVVVPPSRPASPTPTPKPSTSSTAPKPPATTPTTHPAVTGPKKGVAAWSAPGFDAALTSSQASWYYDWSPSRMDHLGTAGPQFVPMIWGAKNADATTLATARTQGSTLLAFNEPDMGSQSNMTVEQALDLWPKLQATGLRLGQPGRRRQRRDPRQLARPLHDRCQSPRLPDRLHHRPLVRLELQPRPRRRRTTELPESHPRPLPPPHLADRIRPHLLLRRHAIPDPQPTSNVRNQLGGHARRPALRRALRMVRPSGIGLGDGHRTLPRRPRDTDGAGL